VDGDPFLDVECDLRFTRGLVSHKLASRYGPVQLPGGFTVKCTIKKVLVHSEAAMVIGYGMSDTPTTGSVHTIGGAAASVSADEVRNNSQAMTYPSRIALTFTKGTGTGITTAGQCLVVGTNSNDTQISEMFIIPTCTTTTTWTGTKVFKTVSHVIYTNVITNGDGTLGTASIAGNVHYVVGDPKVMDLTVGVEKGGKSIIFTLPDGWFSEGGLAFADPDTILEVNAPFDMHHPDELELDVVTP
jgi:hypothetical protein